MNDVKVPGIYKYIDKGKKKNIIEYKGHLTTDLHDYRLKGQNENYNYYYKRLQSGHSYYK